MPHEYSREEVNSISSHPNIFSNSAPEVAFHFPMMGLPHAVSVNVIVKRMSILIFFIFKFFLFVLNEANNRARLDLIYVKLFVHTP